MRFESTAFAALFFVVAALSGCGQKPPADPIANPVTDPAADPGAVKPSVEQDLASEINKQITASWARYTTIPAQSGGEYVQKLDGVEAHLAGKGKIQRQLPSLDEKEEVAHFREIIRRWKEKGGGDLRAEIDAAKGSGRQPKDEDIRKHLGAFQDIEKQVVTEERATYLHAQVDPILDRYRKEHPDLVARYEEMLNKPPHALPKPAPPAK